MLNITHYYILQITDVNDKCIVESSWKKRVLVLVAVFRFVYTMLYLMFIGQGIATVLPLWFYQPLDTCDKNQQIHRMHWKQFSTALDLLTNEPIEKLH